MTPCEKLGYKVGDRFIVTEHYVFACGSIIELDHDDGSEGPLFKLISGSCKYSNAKGNKAGAYCDLNYVKKIEDKEMTHQKKPHRHALLIKAKADDMELVVCRKEDRGWRCGNFQDLFDLDAFDCFLCLPKHKDAVLNALNGGESQIKTTVGWIDAPNEDVEEWSPNYWYMIDDYESRIKPKKEKRWISYNPKTLQVYNCEQNHTPAEGFQVIEIEVEI